MFLLLFNWVGYRFAFNWLQSQVKEDIVVRIDNEHFEESELITLKFPVDNLPYYTNSPIFERVNGEVNLGGMTYRYVERRIYNDSLEVRCLPDAKSTQLTNARDQFFQMVNDLQHTNSTGKQHPAKPVIALQNIITEFLEQSSLATFQPSFSQENVLYNRYNYKIPSITLSVQEQPPDSNC